MNSRSGPDRVKCAGCNAEGRARIINTAPPGWKPFRLGKTQIAYMCPRCLRGGVHAR